MANEVEIVVTSKIGPLRQYAERIESRIRAQGLAVDVLFPHEEIPIRQVLGDLSSRGTLYGIVLSPLNQEHGTVHSLVLFRSVIKELLAMLIIHLITLIV